MKLDFRTLCVAAGMALAGPSALAQGQLAALGCGSLQNGYGPYDYRSERSKLGVVETFHFTPDVEQLRGHNPGSDLDYTLRAFPNHHRALMSMMKLGARNKTSKPRGAKFTVECYFERAEAFRPNDAMVKVIFGLFLKQSGKVNEAVAKLEAASELDAKNANVHYNLGLAYMDLKQYDKALESAHKAYAGGFPLPGLKAQLKRAGKWQELPEAQPVPNQVQGAKITPDDTEAQR